MTKDEARDVLIATGLYAFVVDQSIPAKLTTEEVGKMFRWGQSKLPDGNGVPLVNEAIITLFGAERASDDKLVDDVDPTQRDSSHDFDVVR